METSATVETAPVKEQGSSAPASQAPEAKATPKATKPSLRVSKSAVYDLLDLQGQVDKLRSELGNVKKIALAKGFVKGVREMDGEIVEIVTPQMGSKLRSAGHISKRQADMILAYHRLMEGLAVVSQYDARKVAETLKSK